MLKFECTRCENTTAAILIDSEDDLITECLACGHKELINDYEDGNEGKKIFAITRVNWEVLNWIMSQ